MRVYLLIQDDPFYLPKEIHHILDDNNIVGASVLSQKIPSKSVFQIAKLYLIIFGFIPLFVLTFKGIYNKFFLGENLKKLIKNSSIPLNGIKDINSIQFKRYLSEIQPDVLVSIGCPQIIKKEIRSIPKVATINLHGGYLPDFPGVFTAFWNLVEQSESAGCTVHYVDKNIDGGQIIKRAKFPISDNDSMMDIYEKITRKGIKILKESLEDIKNGRVKSIENNIKKNNYHGFPVRADKKKFSSLGNRII
ncbi:MAG: hypothetical protein CL484_03785 [Acidobacteria bacterium]|nr:hypothetical protein [Acidobacteriota bacterium]|tara:strand:- start:1446 stop:2192 length:747 start_codon:yes stop_codon:yes gene_type:complete